MRISSVVFTLIPLFNPLEAASLYPSTLQPSIRIGQLLIPFLDDRACRPSYSVPIPSLSSIKSQGWNPQTETVKRDFDLPFFAGEQDVIHFTAHKDESHFLDGFISYKQRVLVVGKAKGSRDGTLYSWVQIVAAALRDYAPSSESGKTIPVERIVLWNFTDTTTVTAVDAITQKKDLQLFRGIMKEWNREDEEYALLLGNQAARDIPLFVLQTRELIGDSFVPLIGQGVGRDGGRWVAYKVEGFDDTENLRR